ncbi:MAG TPA: hypothetical protein VKQ29_05485 [Aliidongia sp.]|nr:hypothetical protein [Aliidongia sp.]
MRGFKRLTALALALWCAGMLVSSVTPWEVIVSGRSALDEVQAITRTLGTDSKTPRVLLLGSSPVALGLSAEQIGKETGLPAFNLAAWSALSYFPEYLKHVMPVVHPDDIVIISNPNWFVRANATLGEGCVDHVTTNCLTWRPKPLPHLMEVVKVLSGAFPRDFMMPRDAQGDAMPVVYAHHSESIDVVPFSGRFADRAVPELRQIVEMIRARGACAVLAPGPIYVDQGERENWQRETDAAEARLAKLGLARAVVADDIINTDRSLFLDGYEHPSDRGRKLWSERIVDRLVSKSSSPCSSNLAKAEHLPSHS